MDDGWCLRPCAPGAQQKRFSRKEKEGGEEVVERERELDSVMEGLRVLKADIYALNRSLDGSTIGFALRKKEAICPPNLGHFAPTATASPWTDHQRPTGFGLTPTPFSFPYGGTKNNENRDRRHRRYIHTLGVSARGQGHSSYELNIHFPPPPPPPPSSKSLHNRHVPAAPAAAVMNCSGGVQSDYGGVRDVGQLVQRVETSTRAISREKDSILKALRIERERTARLRDALWQEGGVKREWEMLTEASRTLKRRLESTERVRHRQKELIRELQAVEADLTFADVGGVPGKFSLDPLPEISPPPPPPPPPPIVRGKNDSSSSPLGLGRNNVKKRERMTQGKSSGRRREDTADCVRVSSREKRSDQPGPRRSRPAALQSVERVAFVGGRDGVGLEDTGGGVGNKRLGRATASMSKTTGDTAVRAERPRRSGRLIDGTAKARRSAAARFRQPKGGEFPERRQTVHDGPLGRTRRTSMVEYPTATTTTKMPTGRVENKLKSGASTAEPRRRDPSSAPASCRKRDLRPQATGVRLSPKAKIRAPTAASAGKATTVRRPVGSSIRIYTTTRVGDGQRKGAIGGKACRC